MPMAMTKQSKANQSKDKFQFQSPLISISIVFNVFTFYLFSRAAAAAFSRLWIAASAPTPPKTSPTPSHCLPFSRWPNQRTERSMVSILRVTVTVTRMREEKFARV